eukprot:843894-Pyramimonas_sp.AAC.1
MFGRESAVLRARNLAPKCIAGRWLSAAATEERLRLRWAKEGGRLGTKARGGAGGRGGGGVG